MDVTKTHGAFSWNELMTTDPKAAASFYGQLFGWKTSEMDMGPGGVYHLQNVGDKSVAGIMAIPPDAKGMPPMWGAYVTVDDVDATLERVTQLGGKVCMPPMDVPGVGRMAGFLDPQGAMLSVIKYSDNAG
jgi:uncharacterized protein